MQAQWTERIPYPPQDPQQALQQLKELALENKDPKAHTAHSKASFDEEKNKILKALCSERALHKHLKANFWQNLEDEKMRRDADWRAWCLAREKDIEAEAFGGVVERDASERRLATEQLAALDADRQVKSRLLRHLGTVISQSKEEWRLEVDTLESIR